MANNSRRPGASRIAVAISMAIALLLTTAAGCTTPKKNRDAATARLRLGTTFLQQGNYHSALRELLEADNLDPDDAFTQNNLGLTYFMLEKFDLSAERLERAVKLRPLYSEARNNYGRVLIEVGKYDEAVKQFQHVLADLTYPDPAKVWANMGLAHFRAGAFAEAKRDLSESIRVNRNYCIAHTLYGRTLLELGELQPAATALDNAVVICKSSKFDEPYYYSGLTYYKLGRTSTAVARMEEVIKLYPEGRYAKKAESLLQLMK